jgi:phenylalanyl-tRNA synthetase beta chain
MKVTYNWLKDFVQISLKPRVLADKLTMAGLEVVALQEKQGDFVFEIEITSNRPDWLSVIGIAREVAAITGKKLKPPHSQGCKAARPQGHKPFAIDIEDKKDCPLYIARVIQGVKVGPSPDWLRKRLELIGSRSVNNIVDITNYVLFETGEPLHAFDLDSLSSDKLIRVRRAAAGEKITTIDGEEKPLDKEVLVIADDNKPVAIAGVMGGKDTEVGERTKNILLEAAVFDPVVIRRARQALKLQSEAAYRFERGIDRQIVEKASLRAAELIAQLAGGKCVAVKGALRQEDKPRIINLSVSQVNKVLGSAVTKARARKILASLGFNLQGGQGDSVRVKVPAHRPDVRLEVDLIEEVARIYGYDNIPVTLPAVKPQAPIAGKRDLVLLIKNSLLGLGLSEAITYSLIDRGLLKGFWQEGTDKKVVEIANPLSREQEVLRSSLLPSLARCLAYNLNQKQSSVNIFEIAKVFSQNDSGLLEEEILSIALCGLRSVWLAEEGARQDVLGFLHLKGIIEALLARLGIKGAGFAQEGNNTFLIRVQETPVGLMRKLDVETLKRLDVKNKDLFLAEINLDKLLAFVDLNKKFASLPRFPGISRDISVDIGEDIPVEKVLSLIRRRAGDLLEAAQLENYYRGKQVDRGFKNLTISCRYCSAERTLTEAEINPVHNSVVQALKSELQARLR